MFSRLLFLIWYDCFVSRKTYANADSQKDIPFLVISIVFSSKDDDDYIFDYKDGWGASMRVVSSMTETRYHMVNRVIETCGREVCDVVRHSTEFKSRRYMVNDVDSLVKPCISYSCNDHHHSAYDAQSSTISHLLIYDTHINWLDTHSHDVCPVKWVWDMRFDTIFHCCTAALYRRH